MQIAGLRVVDAAKALPLTITATDVRNGATKDPSCCAAALACRRQGGCTEARVHLGRTYLKIGNKWVRYITPKSLRTEIVAFDRGAKFAAGDYLLGPVAPADRLNRGKARGSATNKTKPKYSHKPRAKYHTVTGVRQHGANR